LERLQRLMSVLISTHWVSSWSPKSINDMRCMKTGLWCEWPYIHEIICQLDSTIVDSLKLEVICGESSREFTCRLVLLTTVALRKYDRNINKKSCDLLCALGCEPFQTTRGGFVEPTRKTSFESFSCFHHFFDGDV
jgi:hypothetical protein